VLGRWKIKAQYGAWAFGDPNATWMKMPRNPTKDQLVGGAALIQLGPDEFLLAGSDIRLSFEEATSAPNARGHFMTVEEGTFDKGQWLMKRRWNGDQTDYGLNLTNPTLLRVRFGTPR